MIFGASILVFACMVVAVLYFLEQLVGEVHADSRRWFWNWTVKGLATPIGFWLVWNTGLLPGLPAIMPQIARLQIMGGNWAWAFLRVAAGAFLVIGSFWAALTLGWILAMVGAREEIRSDFLAVCFLWSVLLVPFGLCLIFMTGWAAAGFAGVLWLAPIANSSLSLVGKKKPGPVYSRAIGKMKMGKYDDAEWEVIHELEKCEDDFEGWMMLAELYAKHFGDLVGAQRTIQDICDSPTATPTQISVALHRLADWHSKLADDPVGARRALETICERMAGTHLATMARHRINQLPASRQELREQRKGRTVHLPALSDKLDEPAIPAESDMTREEAAAQANQFVERLKLDPDNVTAREHLARLFAERLGRAELGIEQVELLLEMPGQPEQKAAEWLSLLAAWHFKYRRDEETCRKFLQRLIDQYPQSAQAFAAQRRVKLLDMEMRIRKLRQPRVTSA